MAAYAPKVPGWIASMGGHYQDAQSFYAIEGVPVPAGTISNPEAPSTSVGDDHPVLLVWPDAPGDSAKGCCPLATWLPSGQVVIHAGSRLLSWRPGTRDSTG